MKITEYDKDLRCFLKAYRYQPSLTNRLDNLGDLEFSQELINLIVLWKVNRYVESGVGILKDLNALKVLMQGEHRKAEKHLCSLLKTRGIDLPMASTILRFRNPKVFQIIDSHAYRAVYDCKYPLYSSTPDREKVRIYFDYLDELLKLCESKGLAFETLDRLLYQFDKDVNGALPKTAPKIR